MVKVNLWLYKIFGERLLGICLGLLTKIIVQNAFRLVTAMAASYIDLFKDLFFDNHAHESWTNA